MHKVLERVALATPIVAMAGILLLLIIGGAGRLSPGFVVGMPSDMGRAGGIGPVLVNTVLVVGSALVIAIALSMSTALWLAIGASSPARRMGLVELGSRRVIEVGLSLPRLLWGLGGAALFGGALGLGISAAAGTLTLAALLCPILVAGFVDGLRQVARRLAPTCRALGVDETTLWWKVVVPEAGASLAATCLLAAGRACGDAAALLLTAGIGTRIIGHPGDPASTLAVHIYMLVELGGGSESAMAAGAVLLLLCAAIQWPLTFSARGRIS